MDLGPATPPAPDNEWAKGPRIEWATDEEVERAATESRSQALAPVKANTPQARWGFKRKVLYWHAVAALLCVWTLPLAALSIPGFFFFILPGVILLALGCLPLIVLLGWYWGDPLLKQHLWRKRNG